MLTARHLMTASYALAVALVSPLAAESKKFNFALIGDQPYFPKVGAQQVYPAQSEYINMITDINNKKDDIEFTIHVGDIKAGDTFCSNDVYSNNLALFNTFANPLIYLPGDNEWTDCHRANNGGFDPVERLNYLRGIYYTTSQSLGDKKLDLTRQSSEAGFELYKENIMWEYGDVLFIGLNQPGSNNNHNRTTGLFAAGTEAEYAARNAANLAWLKAGFRKATSEGLSGVVVLTQANPFERFLETGYTDSGYNDFIRELRLETVQFNKPVLYVGGDTHSARIDKPMGEQYPAPGKTAFDQKTDKRIENFTRVEVFGETDTHWVQVNVDKKNPNLFAIDYRLVEANIKPHTPCSATVTTNCF